MRNSVTAIDLPLCSRESNYKSRYRRRIFSTTFEETKQRETELNTRTVYTQ